MSTRPRGARRSSEKMTTHTARSVTFAVPRRWATKLSMPLLVPTDPLHAPEVVDAVLGDESFHVRPVREVVDAPRQNRPRGVFLELLLDGVDELQALFRVDLLRLLVEHLLHLLVAVVGVVARRAARIVLVEVAVGIVGAQ